MTRLLVSVRNSDEAIKALTGGAALIDVKEPNRGSLGSADAKVIAEVSESVGTQVPVSAALGELVEFSCEAPSSLPASLAYAKLGLSQCGQLPDWFARWQRVVASWPEGVHPVAVIYADPLSNCPPVPEVFQAAVRLGCSAALVDTFDKSRGNLLAHWSLTEVERFVEDCRNLGILSVVAGSLDADAVRQILPLQPDYIAVRGAVCGGSRTGEIRRELVTRLAQIVEAGNPTELQPGGHRDARPRRLDSPRRI